MLSVLALLVASLRRFIALPGAAKRMVLHVVARQIIFTGVEAIPLVALLGGTVGALVILNSADRLPDFGQAEFMGRLLVLVILRELSPVLVAFLVAARSGTAIAAELGTMGTRGEIDGLSAVGVDPLSYVVFPRVLGVATAVVSLNVVFNVMAFTSGFVLASLSRETLSFFVLGETLFRAMTIPDLSLSVMKSLFMGVAIAGICAHKGLTAREASTDVPRVTLQAVVTAFWACLVIELILTGIFTDLGSLTR